jgi:hypothetical protein
MNPQAARRQNAKRVYQAAAELIFSSHEAGCLTETEFEQLTQALEAIHADALTQPELEALLKRDDP